MPFGAVFALAKNKDGPTCPAATLPVALNSVIGGNALGNAFAGNSGIGRTTSPRTFLKRFPRLAPGFSKKLDNLKASVSGFIAFDNFRWRTRHKGNSGKLRATAAMTDRLWSFADLFDADAAAEKERKSDAKSARLAAKLAERN